MTGITPRDLARSVFVAFLSIRDSGFDGSASWEALDSEDDESVAVGKYEFGNIPSALGVLQGSPGVLQGSSGFFRILRSTSWLHKETSANEGSFHILKPKDRFAKLCPRMQLSSKFIVDSVPSGKQDKPNRRADSDVSPQSEAELSSPTRN